ncbi:hypothetical protein ACMYYO_00240 [Dermacoccaceae bacterium W4C1]
MHARDLLKSPGEQDSWPVGRWNLLRGVGFGNAGPARGATLRDLAALTFSPLRHEPEDPYNNHRGYASARCLFPVQAMLADGDKWSWVDAERRRFTHTASSTTRRGIALTGCWSRVPSSYGWFAGGLVALETGILLRHLGMIGAALGLRLRLQAAGAEDVIPARTWTDPAGMAPSWFVSRAEPRSAATPLTARTTGHRSTRPLESAAQDLRAHYGDHRFRSGQADLPSGIPTAGVTTAQVKDWASVIMARSSGRMPRQLWGFRVADAALTAEDMQAQAAWAATPGPSLWDAISDCVRIRLVTRRVTGMAPGVHHLAGTVLRRTPLPAAAVEASTSAYLYDSTPESNNDLAQAPAFWLITTFPAKIVDRLGPAGWSLMHHQVGWITHGLSMAGAARDLLTRPVRAFDERVLAQALQLAPDEMPAIGIVVGSHRPHGGIIHDLRS